MKPLELFAAVVQLLTKAPRTVRELCGLLGTSDVQIRRHLSILEAEGLVARKPMVRETGLGRASDRWEWSA